MKVVVFGATGATGLLVVDALLAAQHRVIAAVRAPARLGTRAASVDVRVVDLAVQSDADLAVAVTAAVAGADAVISCAGHDGKTPATMLARFADVLVAAARDAGVKRVVGLAGGGIVVAQDPPPHLAKRFLRGVMGLVANKMLVDTEAFGRKLLASDLNVTVSRPPRLTDDGLSGRVVAGEGLQLGLSDVLSRADLAVHLVEQLTTSAGRAPYVTTAKAR